MNKIVISITFILFAAILANAQETSQNKILSRFELVAGPSISGNTGYLSEYDSKTGYSFGVGYYQKLYKAFSLNVRAMYEMKGSLATYNYDLVDANGITETKNTFTSKFKYLTLYALPTIQLGRNKNIHISAGGYYSFLQKLSVHSYSTNRGTGDFISESTDTNKNYFAPNYDAGVSFQLGYSFNINNKNQLMLQVYSNRGLVDLHNVFIGSQRNNNLGVMLSWRMR